MAMGCAPSNGPKDTGTTPSATTTGPCGPSPSSLEVGTGEAGFEPLVSGDEIEVIHGAQDGHHILGSTRLRNTSEIATIRYWIEFPLDDTIVSDQTYRMQLTPIEGGEGCDWEAIGLFAYLGRIDPLTERFLDQEVVLRMNIEDSGGVLLNEAITVIPYLTPVERDPVP